MGQTFNLVILAYTVCNFKVLCDLINGLAPSYFALIIHVI